MTDYVDKILEQVKEKIEEIDYGRIIIELRQTSDVVDIITESRKRIKKVPK